MIDPQSLHNILEYCPESGKLFWKSRGRELFDSQRSMVAFNNNFAGNEALTNINYNGYRKGTIFGCYVLAHRVIYALHFGRWPNGQIDHINGDRADNRICNLRVVTQLENSRNMAKTRKNISGHTGVQQVRGKWGAFIGVGNKTIRLGVFAEISDAISARKAAECAYGFHPNHGRERIPAFGPGGGTHSNKTRHQKIRSI